jgi:hypothetical protein
VNLRRTLRLAKGCFCDAHHWAIERTQRSQAGRLPMKRSCDARYRQMKTQGEAPEAYPLLAARGENA